MNPTEKAAIFRGIYSAIGTFGVTFLTTFLVTDVASEAGLVAGIAAFGVLGFRAGAEGAYDSLRQKNGTVQPSDVNATVTGG